MKLRPRRLIALAAAAVSLAGICATGAVRTAEPATAEPKGAVTPSTGLQLRITEIGPTALTPADTLTIGGTARNAGEVRVGNLSVRLFVNTETRLTTRADLEDWAALDPGEAPGELVVDEPIAALDPGASRTFTLTVDASTLGLPTDGAAFGPYGIAVDVVSRTETAGGADPQDARSAAIAGVTSSIVWRPIKEYRPTDLSIVVPVSRGRATADASVMDPALATAFRRDGRLSRLLAATGSDTRIGWTLDPALLEAADSGLVDPGNDLAPSVAPTTTAGSPDAEGADATAGDDATATPTGTKSPAGTATPTTPTSATATPTTTPTATASPTATSPGATSPDATAQVGPSIAATPAAATPVEAAAANAWLRSLRGAIDGRDAYVQSWADPDVVALANARDRSLIARADQRAQDVAADLLDRKGALRVVQIAPGGLDTEAVDWLARRGRRVVILPESELSRVSPSDYTVDAAFDLDRGGGGRSVRGLAVDAGLSAALEAATTLGDPDQAVARQRLLSELAAITLEFPGTPRRLLASLPTTWDADPAAFELALSGLDDADWVEVTRTRTLITQDLSDDAAARLRPVTSTTREQATQPLSLAHVRLVTGALRGIDSFSPALTDPTATVREAQTRGSSIVSTTWRNVTTDELAAARSPLVEAATSMAKGVQVVPGGPYNVLAASGELPLAVSNALPYPVTAVLRLLPRYGLIRMDDAVEVALAPDASGQQVLVPFKGIANGDVPVDTWLETPDGARISAVTTLDVRVRRNWESRGMAAVALGLLALLVVGLWRSVRSGRGQRRRLSREQAPPDVDQVLAARERRELDEAERQEREEREERSSRQPVGAAAARGTGASTVASAPPPGSLPPAARLAAREDRPGNHGTGGHGTGRPTGGPTGGDRSAGGPTAGPTAGPAAGPAGGRPDGGTRAGSPSAPSSAPSSGASVGGPEPHDPAHDPAHDPTADPTADDLPESLTSTEAVMRSSLVMAAGTATSRILGFVRSAVLAVAIGTAGVSADAFSVANKVPNIIYILIAGGVLNAVLVPQITRAAREGEKGKIFVDRLLSVALVALVATTIVVTAAAPFIIRLYSGRDVSQEQLHIGTMFAYWCLVQVFFYGLYTLLGQVLNARGHFGAYMWAPVLNNVVAIVGLVAFIMIAGQPMGTQEWWTAGRVALLAGTATLGVVAQALVLIPVLVRSGFRWRFRWGIRGSGLGGASRIALWTFAAVLFSQVGFIVISKVLTSAGAQARADLGLPPGARPPADQVMSGPAPYDYAYLLFMLPHSLIAVSLVTALFTRLSHSAAAGDTRAVRNDLSLGLRITGTATAGATAVLCAVAPYFTTVMNWNIGIAYAAMAMSLGLVAFSAQYLAQRVFYAYEDARTPFMIQIPVVIVLVGGSLVSAWLLDARWVLVGIGLAMSLSNLVAVAISLLILHGRLDRLDGRRVVSVYTRLVVAAVVSGGIGWVAARVVVGGARTVGLAPATGPAERPTALVALAVAGTVVLAVYGLLLWALRVRELDYLVQPVRRILRKVV